MDEQIKLNIKSARVNKGLTQIVASELIGVSATTLGNWETGKSHPSIEKARKMSEVYEMPLDSLIF